MSGVGLNVGNLPVKQVYVGSTPVREVYVGAEKVWPVGPRTVTIKRTSAAGFEKSSTGDASLIDGWPRNGNEQGVSFTAPVTCDKDVRNIQDFITSVRAGTTIPAGTTVLPGYVGSAGDPYVFTEVL